MAAKAAQLSHFNLKLDCIPLSLYKYRGLLNLQAYMDVGNI